MNYSVFYEIVRYGTPFSAGVYRTNGEFAQVFPTRRTFRTKSEWAAAWSIFGDEAIEAYLCPMGSSKTAQTKPVQTSSLKS
jgi:hypothetical protein